MKLSHFGLLPHATCARHLVVALVSAALAACGGNSARDGASSTSRVAASRDNSRGPAELVDSVSAATRDAGFGRPQDSRAVADMAKRLSAYFNGSHDLIPDSAATESSGTALVTVSATRKAVTSAVPREVYRFLNTQTGVHFFTASVEEKDWVRANLPWFHYEGPAFFALPTGGEALTPVFRFYNKVSGTHFYTVSSAERDDVIAKFSDIFSYEGVSWHASGVNGAGWRPIFRFFNTQTGTHFYTASTQERDNVRYNLPQYLYEGIGYFVRLGGEAFTPLTHPPGCKTPPAPVLSAALPAQFSATLIRKVDTVERPFLNNQGDIAFVHRDLGLGSRVLQYRSGSDGQLRTVVPPDTASAYPSDDLISLNDVGEMLLAQRTGDLMPSDQAVPLNGRPDALRYLPGGEFVSVPGLKVPRMANHRAGRFTFLEAMGGVNDGSGRLWAWNSVPSYLDAGIVGRIADTLYLANGQQAVNHCGWGLDMSGLIDSGLIWMNGNIEMGRWHFGFAFGQDASLRILGTNNRRAVVGYSVGGPVADKAIGYLKYGPEQERAFDNLIPSDVNEKLVAVGSRVELLGASPPSVRELEGAIFTIDGQPQLIKSRVPSLNQPGTKILPLKINDNLQVLASVVLACNPVSNTNAVGDSCGSSYLYLFSPL